MKENRLIYLTAAEKRAQQRVAALQASGATLNAAGQKALAASKQMQTSAAAGSPLYAPQTVTGTPSSPLSGKTSAQVNAATQAATYQQSRAANQTGGILNPDGTRTGLIKTYIDMNPSSPTYGQDTRQGTKDYTVVDPVTGIPTTYTGGSQLSGGTQTTMQTTGPLGYNTQDYQKQGAGDRAQKGITQGQLGQTAGAGGQAGALGWDSMKVGSEGYGSLGVADKLKVIENQMNADLKALADKGGIGGVDAAEITRRYQEMANNAWNEAQAKEGQIATEAIGNTTPTGATTETTTPTKSPEGLGMEAYVKSLPPEQQGLGLAFMEMYNAQKQNQAELKTATDLMSDQVKSVYDSIDKRVGDMEAGIRVSQDNINNLIKAQLEGSEKNIAIQEAAAQTRLAWEREKEVRRLQDEKVATIDSKIARLALTGGIGSSGGNVEIQTAKVEYEKAISNVMMEASVQSQEISARSAALYQQATDTYYSNSINNIKDTTTALERVAGQSIASKQARANAEQGIFEKFITQTATNRTNLATTLVDFAKTIQTDINQQRDDKRVQEQLGWNTLNLAYDNYKTNIPKGILDRVSKLTGVASDQLVASVSGGTGGVSVSVGTSSIPYVDSTGTLMPLEDFLAKKEQEWHTTTGIFGPASPSQRKTWENEFTAMQADMDAYSPSTIIADFNARTANVTLNGPQYKNKRHPLDDYIAQGNYKEARRYVDAMGKPLPPANLTVYKSIDRIEYALDEMTDLIQKVASKTGPIQGPIWEFLAKRVSSDPDYQRLMVVKGTYSALYARGISGEVGVLTNEDINRAGKAFDAISVSYPSALAAIDQARKAVTSARSIAIKYDRANGFRMDDVENASSESSQSFDLTPDQHQFLYGY